MACSGHPDHGVEAGPMRREPRKALGRGIEALIHAGDSAEKQNEQEGVVVSVPIAALRSGTHQPRRQFRDEGLSDLADSIKKSGILQPILVHKEADDRYTIIAGERRARAAKIAGISHVPVLIRHLSDVEKVEIALVENLQREDLTPIEEARAYKSLTDTFGLSQEEVATRVAKNRSTIANSLRLLRLPTNMQEALESGTITAGHARALLMVADPADQERLFACILESALSVREAENLASNLNQGSTKTGGGERAPSVPRPAEIAEIEQHLLDRFGTKVFVRGTAGRGRIEISYYSRDDLERVLEIMAIRL